jgi:chromosomal replication initiator protein
VFILLYSPNRHYLHNQNDKPQKEKYPNKKVHYLTLEKFATDFINSLQNNKANSFKEKYRKYDLLIIDDIQFIGKMEKIQEELFHTFNTFYENNKQIIFSSDKHPNYIPELADRLKSRFAAGMIVDVSEPDYESRLAILKIKLNFMEIMNEHRDIFKMIQRDNHK